MQKTLKHSWGFDTKDMDRSIRPQDDFFHYANGNWIKKNTIPKAESRWGSFTKLRYETDEQLKLILGEVSSKKSLQPESPYQKVRDLYLSGMNIKLREKLGAKPIQDLRETIEKIKTTEDLTATIAELEKNGVSLPWHILIDQDSKNSKKYVLHFFQGGLSMPDKEYYLKDDPEFKRVRNAYALYIPKMLSLIGYKESETKERSKTIMNIETHLAQISMNKVDARDAEKTYHKKNYSELKTFAKDINWDFYFKKAGIPSVPYVIVGQPEFLKGATKLLLSLPISDWKIYLEWHLINGSASLLSTPFIETKFDFYGKTLTGNKEMKPLWRRVLGVVDSGLGEALGEIYVDKHFPKEAKIKMNVLVDNLFEAYKERIRILDWMEEATKKKAITKLSLMNRKIGYPKKFKTYKGLVIKPTEYFENVTRINLYEHNRAILKLKKMVDRNEWHMYPQTVNAYCNFGMNEIVFPAAILQFPFFNFKADDAVNYGAIGAVIGHEITHGFDDQGSKFDGEGNMKLWWTKEDRRRFEQKTKLLVTQYDSYKVANAVPVNGKLTLGENIADLGGLSIALDAYKKHLKKTERKIIDGFTPEERFFLGAAQAEREISRDEYAKMAALNDPHSPAKFRVNGPFSNMDEFYEVYGVKKEDELYREAKKRARIW